ncbi:GntR family transcriptional regulator [Streptomyces sp. NPDC058657]|uniref:GntR family transcriptional regulator n=1 Tax=unclassified Streptomyces TaxID=2593676 RepID=UPI00366162A0
MTPIADAAGRVNEQLAADLQRAIAGGKYQPGEKLPAVRKLAAEFGVSIGTVTKALQLLVQRGAARSDSTRGYFVCAPSEDQMQEQTSPEFVAIMQEIAAVRTHLARLDDRLQQLEAEREAE